MPVVLLKSTGGIAAIELLVCLYNVVLRQETPFLVFTMFLIISFFFVVGGGGLYVMTQQSHTCLF